MNSQCLAAAIKKSDFMTGSVLPPVFWSIVPVVTGTYLWFLRFSNFLTKLVQ